MTLRRLIAATAASALIWGSAPLSAQPGSAEPTKAAADVAPSTRLILLGTAGGPIPRVKRAQPASLLQVGDRLYLIDAGDGVSRQLALAGFQPKAIDRLFITHLHMDHMAGLAPLMAFRWVARPATRIEIYGPAGTRSVADGAAQYLAVPETIFTAQLPPGQGLKEMMKVSEIERSGPVQIYQDDLVKVTAVENSHYDTMDKSRLPAGGKSFAYRFDTPGRSIVFTGDSGPSPAIEALAEGADILVSEVIDVPASIRFLKEQFKVPEDHLTAEVDHMTHEHLTPEEIGKMAARARVKMVILTHAVMGFDNEKDMRAYTDGVRKYFSGAVIMGQDLAEY
ncbi:MBL fold metallo-hydrolase [Sphingobium phenoxybenzoativorans]|uniref:MBL fold metallo-hydrolase n=1 Tax=Sphingobium phenoxybenzoativorans TaxID=1592790 RepID=A0A975K578_9SPHN|nr:MBL fold metallo-hydrolase [Sphingobium phenoxybenzoativorans]QUT05054.1 MBL fold metallo-hydrolase [Sphingobium phenoxybenzoativorans]